jgi:hypothetical protein
MKSLARGYFWWPGLDAEIENVAGKCVDCQQLLKSPPTFPLQPWPWPDQPWTRIHVDYAGPIDGKMLLVIVDAHSKWMEVHVTSSATSAATIRLLRRSFSIHGLPDIVVSDNRPNLVSAEMTEFLNSNGIEHIRTAPYHPASNGLAERAVQTLKASLKKQGGGSLDDKVARFLLSYRVTPHSTTGVPPCELLMGRRLRTLLDRARPDTAARVARKQGQQKQLHDNLGCKTRVFSEGSPVLTRDFSDDGRWKRGQVVRVRGATSYECRMDGENRLVSRHVEQLRGQAPAPTNARCRLAERGDCREAVERLKDLMGRSVVE